MRYRPHRGMLADAMKEMVEVDGIAGLLAHLHATESAAFDDAAVTVEPYVDEDARIGWKNVHMVLIGSSPVGWCDMLPPAQDIRDIHTDDPEVKWADPSM